MTGEALRGTGTAVTEMGIETDITIEIGIETGMAIETGISTGRAIFALSHTKTSKLNRSIGQAHPRRHCELYCER